MSTWLVSSAAQRIELDAQGRGEVSFTVTNSGPAPEQAVFDFAAGPGADRSWFEVVGEPRLLNPQGAAEFTVRCLVPPGAASGLYSLQGVAYSASRPQESLTMSSPVMFEVKQAGSPVPSPAQPAMGSTLPATGVIPPAAGGTAAPGQPMTGPAPTPAPAPVPAAAPAKPKPKRRAGLLIGAAVALVVIVALAAAGFFFLRDNGDGQNNAAPPPPPPAGEVVVPDVTLLPEEQATAILQVSNLTVGEVITVRQRNRKEGTVVEQSIRQGTTVDAGEAVDIAVVRNN